MIELTLFRSKVLPEFWELPFSQRAAVIAHEAGHRHHKHLWIQLLFMFDSREERRRLLHAQEFQADDFAKPWARARTGQCVTPIPRGSFPSAPVHP
jgi:predicted metalloprotease